MKVGRIGFCVFAGFALMARIGFGEEEGWMPLFDGRTLNGWKIVGGENKFCVEDGVIRGYDVPSEIGINTFLVTEKEYSDFDLKVEFLCEGCNSGIQFRSATRDRFDPEWDWHPFPEGLQKVFGYQAEITPNGGCTGRIYDEERRGYRNGVIWLDQGTPRERALAAEKSFRKGGWNEMRVRCDGPRIRTWVNGNPVADIHDGMTRSGFIGLQVHVAHPPKDGKPFVSSGIRFRNIRIREFAPPVAESVPADFTALVLKGFAGSRLDACERNQVAVKDAALLAFPFTQKTETGSWSAIEPGIWQTEFWGKWMHAAVPMSGRLGDAVLKARIAAGVKTVLSTQLSDGYIGNYRDAVRGSSCDVWGAKYVMMGLIHFADAEQETGSGERAFEGARRLAEWVMSEFGPGKRSLGAEGPFNGLMNCSVLEPIVWIYRRTHDRKYLDFAKWIVSELDTNPKGPEMFSFAERRAPLKDCKEKDGGNKAYEKMSCCQGLLDYYIETGDRHAFETARGVAEQALAEEIDITGGGTQYERFVGYRALQTDDRSVTSEMCVIITWMRLCEKLLLLTGESKWADEIERSFYNAYLAGLSADGKWFASYGGLGGVRERRPCDQCRMQENCCDANGPRGFVAFGESVAMARGDTVWLNQYVHGKASVACSAAKDGRILLDQFNDYPRKLSSSVTVVLKAPTEFMLNLRVPDWGAGATVVTSWGETNVATKAGWIALRRRWETGDQVRISFAEEVRSHELNGHVAFTRGPVVLARDARFHDGDFSEAVTLEEWGRREEVSFRDILPPDASMHLSAGAFLRMGTHGDLPRQIGFCDFASAGNTHDARSFFRVWLPVRK